jgi:cardiolipin synthase
VSISLWTLAVTIATAWALLMAVTIVMQRRPAASTIAWLLVLIFLPLVGLVIFRFIGPLRLERKKLRRRRTRALLSEALGSLAKIEKETGDHEYAELARVGMNIGEAPPLRADALELYTEGAPAYEAILAAIAAAKDHVHLEYYIWEPDGIGLRLIAALAEKARAGVRVRMLVDGMGARGLKRRHLAPLREAGGMVAWFNPVSLRTLRGRRADFRTHRKIVVCDGRVGFTGGINVTDEHSAEFRGAAAWRDTHLRIEGSAVRALQRVFLDDWYFATDQAPAEKAWDHLFPRAPQDAVPGPHIVQVLASGPDATVFPIHRAFFTAINVASRRLYVTTPYFIPDEPILTALISAALRGVDVRLLIPEKGDSRVIDLAARSYLLELIEAGVRVYEYLPRFIHAKTMAVDEALGVVGTANLDNRSFRLNFEVAALVFDREINTALVKAFVADLEHAREVTRVDVEKAPFVTRLGQAGARLMSPLL